MSQTTSAPAPEPNASPAPPGQATISIEQNSPPPPQPGPVPIPPTGAPAAEPTLAPETPTAPEPTLAPEPAAAAATNPVATTAGLIPEPTPRPTLSSTPSLPEPIVTSAEIETAQDTPVTVPVPEPTQTVPEDTIVAPQMTLANMANVKAPASATESASEIPTEIVEPQNALTNKFTENEWAALKELRAKLPDAFAEAFPDNENARSTPVTIWGVAIDPYKPHADARVSVILMKFLRARNLSISDTCDKLIGTLRWRESFNIQGALEEHFPQDVFGNLAHISGTDKEGRLVVYNIYGGNQDLKAVFGDVQRFIRWRVALMEKSVMHLDFTELDQMIQVHDYEGVSLRSRDANSKAAAAEATNIFQNHYPEMLHKKFFVNVPTLLNWIFWLFKPLVSANTLAKMSVVGTGQHAIKKALSDYITLNEIPKRYGGEGEAF